LPPLEFDKPFLGELILVRGNKDRMAAACPKTIYPVTLGCSYRFMSGITGTNMVCLMIIADDSILKDAPYKYEVIYRHERAHCHGWPANHPGARPLNIINESLRQISEP
jgi:hypothetical protein